MYLLLACAAVGFIAAVTGCSEEERECIEGAGYADGDEPVIFPLPEPDEDLRLDLCDGKIGRTLAVNERVYVPPDVSRSILWLGGVNAQQLLGEVHEYRWEVRGGGRLVRSWLKVCGPSPFGCGNTGFRSPDYFAEELPACFSHRWAFALGEGLVEAHAEIERDGVVEHHAVPLGSTIGIVGIELIGEPVTTEQNFGIELLVNPAVDGVSWTICAAESGECETESVPSTEPTHFHDLPMPPDPRASGRYVVGAEVMVEGNCVSTQAVVELQ